LSENDIEMNVKYLIDKLKAELKYLFFPKKGRQLKLAKMLRSSDFFDEEWYLNEYPDVASSGMPASFHYISNGFSEGRLPGPLFDEEHYVSQLSEAIPTGLPPLVHYELYGRAKGFEAKKEITGKIWWENLAKTSRLQRSEKFIFDCVSKPVTIVIPIFNGARFVKKCIDSVLQASGTFQVILVDDCSEEVEISDLLRAYSNHSNISVIQNPKNRGFTKTVNRGIQAALGSDIIILNSDTVVPRSLVVNLKYAAYRKERIGTVTPLSNSAGPFSVPIQRVNSLKPSTPDELTRLFSHALQLESLDVPTGHGFCMYIKSGVFDSTGLFDEGAFPRGYGEENDLCFKARLAGWINTVDARTFVFHEGTKSFKAEKVKLVENGVAKLNERYEGYDAQINKGFSSKQFQFMKRHVSFLIENFDRIISQCKPRILFVIATEDGGTAKTNKDLMKSIQDKYETFLLKSNSRRVSLYLVVGEEEFHLETCYLSLPITPYPHVSREYDNLLLNLVHLWSIELVHVRQIAWHSIGFIKETLQLGIPTVYSIHDFYPICPSVKLLDNNNNFCGGQCTPGIGMCNIELWPNEYFTNLKHNEVKIWRQMFNTMLTYVHSIVTTSEFAKNVTIQNLPSTLGKPFHVIPHGRNFPSFAVSAVKPKQGKKVKLLMLGTIARSKGSDFILPILEKFQNFEVHLLGKLSGIEIKHPRFYEYGAYKRDELSLEIERIKPSWGLLLSIWPETWCHTLTEMWAFGLPVVAFGNGAVKERICSNKCGVLVKNADMDDLFKILSEISEVTYWQKYVDNVTQWQNNEGKNQSLEEMSKQYMQLYNSIMNEGRQKFI
jgi:GT2 family glycosyltransferase/glycosyltransferase involved in cell wall biosynthesis